MVLNEASQEEDSVIATLTGFSLNNVLSGLDLPTGPGLSNQLGISGVPTISEKQIYNERWDSDDEAVGPGEGQDWEDEVDRELAEEEEEDIGPVKMEVVSPTMGHRPKRKRIVRRRVERPKTVYERFPTFEKDRTLYFTELFKGVTVHKSLISKRPLTGTCCYISGAKWRIVCSGKREKLPHDHLRGLPLVPLTPPTPSPPPSSSYPPSTSIPTVFEGHTRHSRHRVSTSKPSSY